ncbi:hypothetical protein ABZP36_011037 [Zizania latifolia]
MEIAMVCTRVILFILILSLCSPYKFMQSPMDFGPLNLLPTTTTASSDFGRDPLPLPICSAKAPISKGYIPASQLPLCLIS